MKLWVIGLGIAAASHAATQPAPEVRLVIPTGHNLAVRAITASSDGQRILTVAGQHAVLWDRNGVQLRRIGGLEVASHVALSPDGRFGLIAGQPDASGIALQVVDARDGQVVELLAEPSVITGATMVDPGTLPWRLAYADQTSKIAVIDNRTRFDLVGQSDIEYQFVAAHPAGLVAVSADFLELWSLSDRRLLRQQRLDKPPRGVVVSPSGEVALYGSFGLAVYDGRLEGRRLLATSPVGSAAYADGWNWVSGNDLLRWNETLRTSERRGFAPMAIFAAGDVLGKLFSNGVVELGGRSFSTLPTISSIEAIALDPDGERLWSASGRGSSSAQLAEWSLPKGTARMSSAPSAGFRAMVATLEGVLTVDDLGIARFGQEQIAEGTRGATASETRIALWSESEVRWFEAKAPQRQSSIPARDTISAAWSGDRLVVLSRQGQGSVISQGKVKATFQIEDAHVLVADEDTIYVAGFQGRVGRFRVDDGKELSAFEVPERFVKSLALSDGDQLAVGGWSGTIHLIDVRSGSRKPLQTGLGRVQQLHFARSGRWLASLHDDGTVRFWDASSGAALGTAVALPDGRWAVSDPEGRYDSSDASNTSELYWLVGTTPLDLHQLRDSYYDAGILSKRLGYLMEPVRVVPELSALRLPPRVTVVHKSSTVEVTVEAITGLVGRIEILWDGTPVQSREPNAARASFVIDLDKEPFLSRRSDAPSRLQVRAYGDDGALRSRAGSATVPALVSKPTDPRFYGIYIGTNYAGQGALRLSFAEADAQTMHDAMSLLSRSIYRDRVQMIPLIGPDARRSKILQALEDVRSKARAHDVVFVYIAGHGMTETWGDRGYRYLTAEASEPPTNDSQGERVSISDRTLRSYFVGERGIRARNKAIVLDTCAAGGLGNALAGRSDSDVQRAFADLHDRGGMTVLSGCAAEKASYEEPRVGHGLLTYALLDRLNQGAADPDLLMSDLWFIEAERRVGSLLDELDTKSDQRPRIHGDRERAPVPLGYRSAVKDRLQLASIRPLVILQNVVNKESPSFDDDLNLRSFVVSAMSVPRGPGVRIAHGVSSKAVKLNLTYRIIESEVIVEGTFRSPTLDSIAARGSKNDLAALAATIVKQVAEQVEKQWQKTKGN